MALAEVSTRTTGGTATAPDEVLRELLARMSDGDQRALEHLYDLTVRRVYTVAVRIVRSPELAEEVVEDAYWQAWRERQRYDAARGRVLTWLLTIARTRALDALRRRDPAEAHADVDRFRAHEEGDCAEPSALIEAVERSSAVHAALQSLKPQVRQLVCLAFFRGMTQQEIAETSGLPLGTVKATLFRAYQEMKVRLAGSGLEPRHE